MRTLRRWQRERKSTAEEAGEGGVRVVMDGSWPLMSVDGDSAAMRALEKLLQVRDGNLKEEEEEEEEEDEKEEKGKRNEEDLKRARPLPLILCA